MAVLAQKISFDDATLWLSLTNGRWFCSSA